MVYYLPMSKNNPALTIDIIRSINAISEESWNRLFGADIIEGFGYQKTLEESHLKEFTFGYCLGRRGGRTVSIIPFFIMDFSLDILLPECLSPAIAFLRKISPRFLKMKVIFLGSPTAEDFYFGIEESENLSAVLDLSLGKIHSLARKEKAAAVCFHNLSSKNKALIGYLERNGFLKMETLPTTLLTIKADSWEDYLAGLSKNTRKDLKKKFRRSADLARLTTELLPDIKGISEEVYKLYLNNLLDSGVHFETLTPEFFLNISKNMPGVAKFFVTRDRGKIVAFNLCLVKNDTCIDKFIGFEREVAHKYHLYYTTFSHNLQWCIKNGVRLYQLGVSDYSPKVRLGARIIPLYIYARVLHPITRLIIKSTKKFIEPKNMDPSLNGPSVKKALSAQMHQ